MKGWNHEPYIGAGEFYLEYGDFDVTLTVPAEDIVAATGELQNPEQVLTAAAIYFSQCTFITCLIFVKQVIG